MSDLDYRGVSPSISGGYWTTKIWIYEMSRWRSQGVRDMIVKRQWESSSYDLSLAEKDLRLALESAAEIGTPMPLTEAAHGVLAEPTRRAAQQAAGGDPVDLDGLLDQLAADERVPLGRADLARLMADPERFAGTAPKQTARVIEAARDVVARHRWAAAQPSEVRL